MIDWVGEKLASQCDDLVVCGRDEPGFSSIPDRPDANIGPLGGLNAALHYAAQGGYEAVLSAGCDAPNLPPDLADILRGNGAAIVRSQPVVGFWPISLATDLDVFLTDGGRALYGFAESVHARQVAFDPPLLNVNHPHDLPDD